LGILVSRCVNIPPTITTSTLLYIDQTERKGLGHAVGLGLSAVEEPVLIILGDVILELDFKTLSQRTDN
jgi:UTP-glucose-1-phosphate uridylyltransferase